MHAPYFELAWLRFFAHLRPSRYPGALPILEALVIGPLARLRVVLDVGEGSALQACRTANTLALTTRMRRWCGNSVFRQTSWLRVCRDRIPPSWARHSACATALFTIMLKCSALPDHEDETEDDRRDAKPEP